MEVTYRKNLHKSYMCIHAGEEPAEEYELCMLEGRDIPYLLAMETVLADGQRQYFYDISGKQQLEDYLLGKKMDYGILWSVLCSIRGLCAVLPEYLLREGGICLEPEYIYVNLEDRNLYFAYLPFGNGNLPEAFERYMEQTLRKIDHQDRMATELGYQVYQMCMMENANMQGIFESLLKKGQYAMPSPESQQETAQGNRNCEYGEPDVETTENPPRQKRILGKLLTKIEKAENPIHQKRISGNLFGRNSALAGKAPWLSSFLESWKEEPQKGKKSPETAAGEQGQKESGFWSRYFPCMSQRKSIPVKCPAKTYGESYSKEGFHRKWKKKREIDANNRQEAQRAQSLQGLNNPQRPQSLQELNNPQRPQSLQGLNNPQRPQSLQERNADPQSLKNAQREEEPQRVQKAQRYQIGSSNYCHPSDVQEPEHPTEILGARTQEPAGKLVYQGIHGCEDILVSGEVFLLGKNRQQAEGIIEAEGVSRLHAKISRQEGEYYLEDLNSTNGTYLNGNPVEYHQKKKLHRGDKIRFGAEEFLFS